MRKFLLFSILVVSVCFARDPDDIQNDFLRAYHGGSYSRAHELLRKAYQNAETIQIWEERLHLQADLSGCDFQSKKGTRALALLRIGRIDEADAEFGDDSVSLRGRANLSLWESDLSQAREFLKQALAKDPDNPELLFLGANIVQTDAEALVYFKKFLQQKSENRLKVLAAKQGVDFFEKTKGKELNVASLSTPVEKLKSQYEQGRLLIHGNVDGATDVKLLVDTGAAGLSFEEKDWRPQLISDLMMIGFGQDKISYGKRVVFDQFSAGKFSLRNAVAAISSDMHAGDVDGVTGSVIFANYLVLLPMQSGRAVFIFPASEQTPLDQLREMGIEFRTSIKFPFYLIDGMMVLKGRVKRSGADMDILVDTGAHRSVVSLPTAERYARIDPMSRHSAPQLFGLGGSVSNIQMAENVEVQIGTIKRNFNEMVALNLAEINEAMELDLDFILGQDFLSGYCLLIDYRNRTLTLLK